METKANYVAVGGFVLICMLGLVVTLLWLAGAQYSQEYVYFQTSFKGPVTGLGDGTTVRYNGIDVGHVTELKFDPNDPQKVIAKLQLKPDLHIRRDSEASIESEGLTGGSYVEVSGGTKKSAELTALPGQVPVIRSSPSTLQQLVQSAPHARRQAQRRRRPRQRPVERQEPQDLRQYPRQSRHHDLDPRQAFRRHRRDVGEFLAGVADSGAGLDQDRADSWRMPTTA